MEFWNRDLIKTIDSTIRRKEIVHLKERYTSEIHSWMQLSYLMVKGGGKKVAQQFVNGVKGICV
jgi:hypothetical protein